MKAGMFQHKVMNHDAWCGSLQLYHLSDVHEVNPL